MSFSSDVLIHEWVELGLEINFESPVIVGKPCTGSPSKTTIDSYSTIRSFTVIYENVTIGERVSVGHSAVIRERNTIGDKCKIGTHAVLEPGNVIGSGSRIHTGCFLENVTIENDVFIGPNVVFTDDPHPPCPEYERCLGGATVKQFAKIGANSTILPGVIVGRHALVGAASVVTTDVPDYAVGVGNPFRIIGDVRDLKCDKDFYKRPYEWEPYLLGDK